MGNSLSDYLVFTTIKISNEWGGSGSGFIVQRAVGGDQARFFYVTNKHVIHPDSRVRTTATTFIFDCNVRGSNDVITSQKVNLSSTDNNGDKVWREHPGGDVDVAAIETTVIFVELRGKHAHMP